MFEPSYSIARPMKTEEPSEQIKKCKDTNKSSSHGPRLETKTQKAVKDMKCKVDEVVTRCNEVISSLKADGAFFKLMQAEFWSVKDQIVMEAVTTRGDLGSSITLDFFAWVPPLLNLNPEKL